MILSEIRKLAKRSQFIYFSRIRLCNRDYKINRRKMAQSAKSSERIAREMRLVEEYWGCKPLHYVRYGLFDKELSDEQLLDYIPPYYFYNYYTSKLSDSIDRTAYRNKQNQYRLFVERGIPTADTVAFIKNGSVTSVDGRPMELGKLPLVDGDKLFVKPAFGKGGTGILAVKKHDGELYCCNRKIKADDIADMLDRNGTYVVQYGLKQRSDLSFINPSSVNTLRVVTQLRDAKPFMSVCVMRIGRNGKDVDNSHQGGLSVGVDVDSGRLFPTATAEHGGGTYMQHPDTGFVFDGFAIEGWERLKGQILDYASRVPEIAELAWDVAVTDKGAVIIEINLGYGLSHLQCCCGGMRRALGVYPESR